MKRFAFLAVILFAQAACALTPMPANLWAKVTTKEGTVNLNLEIVSTPQTRETGLMHRTIMGPMDGMIFLFPKPVTNAFWMKNTPMSLDIIFISPENRITYIARKTTPQSLTPVGNGVPYQATIEIAGGRAAKENIRIGDSVEFRLPEDVHVE